MDIKRKLFLIILFTISFSIFVYSGNFSVTDSGLEDVLCNCAEFGHLDHFNIGTCDLIITSPDIFWGALYLNNQFGEYFNVDQGTLISTIMGSVSLGDINNDGLTDAIVTGGRNEFGKNSSIYISLPYPTEINEDILTNMNCSASVLGDIDNDGDLDLILAGFDVNDNRISQIYQNDGVGYFSEINTGTLTPVAYGSLAFGDIDNDGDLDLILEGMDSDTSSVAIIYQNDGLGNFTEINPGSLTGVGNSSMALGDIDADGDLDLIIGGCSMIYQNDGTGSFTEIHPGTIGEVVRSSIALGDLDNDGDFDLISTGRFVSSIYENDGTGYFTKINTGSLPIHDFAGFSTKPVVALGDVDYDGDLDLFLHYNAHIDIFKNDETVENNPPDTPTNLIATDVGGYWRFSWDTPSDDHTPSIMLRYQIYIRKVNKNKPYLFSYQYHLPRGQSNIGNVPNPKDCCFQSKIPITTHVFWRVIALDSCFKASRWSTMQATGGLAPEAVHDLTRIGLGYNYVTLTWTAPHENYIYSDEVILYDIRYSTSVIEDSNWGTCTQVINEPVPSSPGTLEIFTVSNLNKDTTYYFGIKSKDEEGFWSDLSNIVSVHTGVLYANGTKTISYDVNDGYHFLNWILNIRLRNDGVQTATNVSVEIVDKSDWVIVEDATAAYPDIAPGQEGWSLDIEPFKFNLINRPALTNYIMVWLNISYDLSGSRNRVSEQRQLKIIIPDFQGNYVPTGVNCKSADQGVKINWNKLIDINGYNVYRLESDLWEKINLRLINKNLYLDKNVTDGKEYSYKVTSVKDGKESGYSAVIKITYERTYYSLSEVKIYPNPARDKVTFNKLPKGTKISIYTISGDLVYEVQCKSNKEDWFLVNKAGKKIGNGIYYYTIENKGETKTGKLAIVK